MATAATEGSGGQGRQAVAGGDDVVAEELRQEGGKAAKADERQAEAESQRGSWGSQGICWTGVI